MLDVGCSTGYFAEALAARGNDVVGLEYDEESARAAQQRGLDVLVADLESVDLVEDFGEASLDVVVYADVLEHLRDPLPVLRATLRVLKPGGFVVISLPNVAHGDVRLALLDGRFDYTPTGILDDTHTRFFTRRSLIRFVRDAGFAVAELRRTRAPLFHTELGVDPDSFDAGVVERVLRDPDSTTYQFVVKAVVDDASAATLGHAEELYEAQVERDRLVDEVARLREHVVHLEGVVAQRDTALEALRAATEQERAAAARELEAVKQSRRRLREQRNRLRDAGPG